MTKATKEVKLEELMGNWRRVWYLYHGDMVQIVDYDTFKKSNYTDVSKYDDNGCL